MALQKKSSRAAKQDLPDVAKCVDQPLTAGGPASKPGHVCLQACFVDEHEPLGIDVVLVELPKGPTPCLRAAGSAI
ncbi:MAG TPA: hypothetical protein VMR25_02195 [Planctomycetaceae bacterium]|jgi:hypothetical protein|nr:hypothetical protein [Planctomycetaceae bacterium]